MITSSVNRVIYKGNGSATEFAYPFKIFDRTDIKVLLLDKEGNRKILTSDYYVDMEAMKVYYPGYAPGAEEPETERPSVLAEGETLVVYREVPIDQMDKLPDNHPFNVIEKMDDKSCVIDQQLKDAVERSVKFGEEASVGFDGILPFPVDEGNYGIRINKEGFELTKDPGSVYDETVAVKNAAETASVAAQNAANTATSAKDVAVEKATQTQRIIDGGLVWVDIFSVVDGKICISFNE